MRAANVMNAEQTIAMAQNRIGARSHKNTSVCGDVTQASTNRTAHKSAHNAST